MSIGNFPKIPKIAFIKVYDASKYAKNAICGFLNEFFMIFDDFGNVVGITALNPLRPTAALALCGRRPL